MNDMTIIGHNSGTPTHQLNAAIAGLGLAIQDARTIRKNDRNQMVLVARCLLAVDEATAGNEELSDAQVKAAGIVAPTDLIANANERTYARWLARGGVAIRQFNELPKKAIDINDLSAGSLNQVEGRFLTSRKFAKTTTYTAIYNVFLRECRTEIRKALDGLEGAPTMKEVTDAYGDSMFKADTVIGWITEETEKRSEPYQLLQDLKKATALLLDKAKDDETQLAKLEKVFKDELAEIRAKAAQLRAEKEAKEKAATLTAHQRRTIQDGVKRSQEGDAPREVTDDDF
jgi:hypothetical protein